MPAAVASALVLLVIALAPAAAPAEHEVQYRYTVLGYVKDGHGRPRAGVEVELVRAKTGFSYLGQTDPAGLYVIVARLGDEGLGEALRLQVGGQSVTLRATFDPRDHRTERGTRVDWVGAKAQESPSAFPGTLRRFLAQ